MTLILFQLTIVWPVSLSFSYVSASLGDLHSVAFMTHGGIATSASWSRVSIISIHLAAASFKGSVASMMFCTPK